MKILKKFRNKKLVVFDMDGTLTPSKAQMGRDMGKLLARLLALKKVAVIGGGKYELFKWQFLRGIKFRGEELKNLFLFPTSSTSFYRFKNSKWTCIYSHALSPGDKKKIRAAFKKVFREVNYAHPKKTYGPPPIEDRGTQITFSALGQKAPISLKESWNKKYNGLRARMASLLQKQLPRFAVRVGGLTSIDVTERGIDKAYGIRQIEKHLKIPRSEMLFLGDAIFPGGNDYAVVRAGVDYVKVRGPEDTKKVIKFLLSR